jgi:hypothetical protein
VSKSIKKSLLIELQYFGTINWIKSFSTYSHVKIEICDNWQKGGWRNRTAIAGADGRRLITVPLLGGRDQRGPYSTVKISYKDNWPEQHIRTIESCYRRSPFYEYYAAPLFDLLRSRPEFLVHLNLAILEKIRDWIFPEIVFTVTDCYDLNPGPAYDDLRNGSENGVKGADGTYNKGTRMPVYQQVFEDRNGFISGLGILDLLFCCGPSAKSLLKDSV